MMKMKYVLVPVFLASFTLGHVSVADSLSPALSADPTILLTYNYDLTGTHDKSVYCVLADVGKAWLTFPSQGTMQQSGTYGHNELIQFSINASQLNSGVDKFSADAKGTITIQDADPTSHGVAYCTVR